MNVYDKAIDVLNERGWARNPHGKGPTCLLGAVAEAKGVGTWNQLYPQGCANLENSAPEIRELVHVIYEQYRGFVDYVTIDNASLPWQWNDEIAGSADDVVAILQKASAQHDEFDGAA